MANPGIVKFILGSSATKRAELTARLVECYPLADRADMHSAAQLARRHIKRAEAELAQQAVEHPEHTHLIEAASARYAGLRVALRGW